MRRMKKRSTRPTSLTRPSPSRRGLKFSVRVVKKAGRSAYKAVPFAKGTEMNLMDQGRAPRTHLQGRPLREGD